VSNEILQKDNIFGRWRIVEYLGNIGIKNTPGYKRNAFKVVCECGYIGIVEEYRLRKGKSKGCRSCKTIDKTGKRSNFDLYEPGSIIGNWKVLNLSHLNEKKEKIYLCECQCGFQSHITGTRLTKKETLGCRQCQVEGRFKTKELEGMTFGHTKIIKKLPIGKTSAAWYLGLCLKCNTTREIRGAQIRYFKESQNMCNSCAAKGRNEKAKIKQSIQSDSKS
jgi:hypothetical protein